MWRAITLNRFPLKMKGKVYRCCVRSAILYRSEIWCLKENENTILKTERGMVRAMCSQNVVDRKMTKKQMVMLGLKETIDRLAIANGVRWYGHVLRRDDHSVLKVALTLEVSGKIKRGRPKNLIEVEERDWFEEGECLESSKVEKRSASNCRKNGVYPAISAKETIPDKNGIITTNCYFTTGGKIAMALDTRTKKAILYFLPCWYQISVSWLLVTLPHRSTSFYSN